MVAHPFVNNQHSCQSIGENATLFMSEHTLFSCDLQWMPKECQFAVKSLPRRLIQRAKRANVPLNTCGMLWAVLCFHMGRIGKPLLATGS